MHSAELIRAIQGSLGELVSHADELRDLDQALGDGDLGITVTLGAHAVIEALDALGPEATPSEIARTGAAAVANANPSPRAGRVAGGLLAGSKSWADTEDVDVAAAARFVRAAGDNIAQRGKTTLGDKTILDAIMPAADALAAAPDGSTGLPAAIAAAEKAVVDTRDLQSRRGRASWLQERSIGLRDPGATAMWRFLESWQRAADRAGTAAS
jgi:dihydroxyacetone kinase-like protein